MGNPGERSNSAGKWMALTAALLGWMFDGLEMGLFPLVARPALHELLGASVSESSISRWFAVATAGFLIGAATGGVLFGWLGDRLGRVRAMTLSVLTYAVFSGLCGFATSAEQVAILRFISALGMGGEWSLGVALVMEVWPNRSRALLAGLIGAAANFGYMLIALLGLGLSKILEPLRGWLVTAGLSSTSADWLTAHSGWRILMLLGATPAILTFFIRLFVPESTRWRQEKQRGTTSHWAATDLFGVAAGAVAACWLIVLWATDLPAVLKLLGGFQAWTIYLGGSVLALLAASLAFLYPVIQFLKRAEGEAAIDGARRFILGRMLLGAGLSGIPLLATWAAVQWGPTWADQLADRHREAVWATPTAIGVAAGGSPLGAAMMADPRLYPKQEWKSYMQLVGSLGAVFGTIAAALLADWIGRRLAYFLMCISSLGSLLFFYLGNQTFGAQFLVAGFFVGFLTASFYGWLPLYLPELFPTKVRATGQGFSFNFGRILAAVGVMQTGTLMGLFEGGYPEACSIMGAIYLVGAAFIWLAPETRGQPLPD